jgi:hypothetical protein
MGFDYFKEPRSVFAVQEGERSMKDTVHPAVHLSVHSCGERKLCGALRLRFTRRLILDTGKTRNGLVRRHFVTTGIVAVPLAHTFAVTHAAREGG